MFRGPQLAQRLGSRLALTPAGRPFCSGAARDWSTSKAKIGTGVGRISDLVIESARGSWMRTVEGQNYLDFTSGIGVTNTGHCHPKVVQAVQEQAGRVVHAQVNVAYHRPMLELVDQLAEILPGGSKSLRPSGPDSKPLDSFVFGNSGAEAVENAVKLARQATGRQNVIVMQGGFHGRSLGAMSLTTSRAVYRAHFGPVLSGIFQIPFPFWKQVPGWSSLSPEPPAEVLAQAEYTFPTGLPEHTISGHQLNQFPEAEGSYVPELNHNRATAATAQQPTPAVAYTHQELFDSHSWLDSATADRLGEDCLQQLDLLFKQSCAPSETAAILLEPVIGEGGYVAAPESFLRGLRERCDRHGILLILDEVQTGFGRTGTLFAADRYTESNGEQLVPDIMCLAKGLASGHPLSAIATRTHLSSMQPPGSMGGTYTGNALSCAAALATMELMHPGVRAKSNADGSACSQPADAAKPENGCCGGGCGKSVLDTISPLVFNGAAIGARIRRNLNALAKEVMRKRANQAPLVGDPLPQVVEDVRGQGCMNAIQFNEAVVGAGFAARVVKRCVQNNLLILSTSSFEVVRFIPALSMSEAEADLGMQVFRQSVLDELLATIKLQ